jgi:Glycosyl hydrolases family 38 C-terminal domain
LFFPGEMVSYDLLDQVKIENGGYVVSAPNWKRIVVEKTVPMDLNDGRGVQTARVIDFVYKSELTRDNEEWFVRFNGDIKNDGYFHTDLNGFNFDTHRFRSDMPIQSQVFPMPTLASIQDEKLRMTVLSEHAQGTASLQDGAIDVWLDRRLRQDDNRGLGQGVLDNRPLRTRFRVVLETEGYIASQNDFDVTSLVRRMWNELQHPLEMLGQHTTNVEPLVAAAGAANDDTSRLSPAQRADYRRLSRESEREELIRRPRKSDMMIGGSPQAEAAKSDSYLGFFGRLFGLLGGSQNKKALADGNTPTKKKQDHDSSSWMSFRRAMENRGNDFRSGWSARAPERIRPGSPTPISTANITVPFVYMVYNRVDYLKQGKETDPVTLVEFSLSLSYCNSLLCHSD